MSAAALVGITTTYDTVDPIDWACAHKSEYPQPSMFWMPVRTSDRTLTAACRPWERRVLDSLNAGNAFLFYCMTENTITLIRMCDVRTAVPSSILGSVIEGPCTG